MGEYLLKILTDILFYLAIFIPLIVNGAMPVRIVLAAVPVVWAVWIKMNWKTKDFMEALRENFFFQVKLLIFISCLEVFFLGLSQWSKLNAPLAILFAVVGIMAVKTGRISEGNQRKGMFWLVCGLEIAAVVAVVLFLSSKLFTGSVLALLGGAYNMLVLPVLLFMIQCIAKVLEWIWPFLMKIFSKELKFQASDESITISGDLNVELEQAEQVAGAEFFKVLGIVIAVVAVVLFLWYLYKKFSKTYDTGRKTTGTVSRSELTPQERQEEKRPLFGGERNVRYYYRKFMKLCMKRGGWGKGVVTSDHIHKAALFYWDEKPLSELRELYLGVRYGGKSDGAEEKQRAKEIYKSLKAVDTKKE